MTVGELVTRGTIDVALLLYAVVLAGHLWFAPSVRLAPSHRWLSVSRLLWTVGCLVLWLHIAAAFHYYHQWSHAAAVAETARQTREIVGWEFGGGIYFNWLFAMIWSADCLWWWGQPQGYVRRPRWVTWLLHGYLAFIAFQAVVVFEAGITRAVGILASAALLWLLVRYWFMARRTTV